MYQRQDWKLSRLLNSRKQKARRETVFSNKKKRKKVIQKGKTALKITGFHYYWPYFFLNGKNLLFPFLKLSKSLKSPKWRSTAFVRKENIP